MYLAANATGAAVSEVANAATTAAVSEAAWGLVAHHVAAPALCALGASCRRTYVATRGVVPGLRPSLSLFAHQRNGLCYMLRKERGGRLGRGGLLCDEPGMGKTLTLLAALLRTARLRARPGTADERCRRRSACRAAGEVACVDGGGTLIVAPVAVLDHWKAEILRHVAGPSSDVGAVLDHPVLGQLRAVQAGNFWAADSNSYFSRPAPRIVDGAELIRGILDGPPADPTQAVRVLAKG